ncbi:endonuclease [uncultured Coprobacter sp.]|uniref:endonuclease n=1 Tax=uncultured Coprobacter sp. TaxID=1720550 RepID=UPI0025D7A06B|nr:endonuclease [uncultured Coprobacter sp.]
MKKTTCSLRYSILFLFLTVSSLIRAQIPAGYYYQAHGKTGAELKTALHNIIKEASMLKYGSGEGATWEGFFYTDQNPDGSVFDMYSNEVRYFNGFNGIDGMHIEHSLPNSWWGGIKNNAYKDLYHLYPADATMNMSKSNNPLGEVSGTPIRDNGLSKMGKNGFGNTYTGNCFEPADIYKGDFARSYFYIATAYEDYASLWNSPMMQNNTWPVWQSWALQLLMEWNENDLKSYREEERAEAVYKIQGNRNPFIDYPDLVDYIWGDKTSTPYPFPDETEPFLISPRNNKTLDFGILLQGDNKTIDLDIQGKNLTETLNLYWKTGGENAGLSLSQESVTANEAINGKTIQICYMPRTSGTGIDTLVIKDGGLADSVIVKVSRGATEDFMALPATETTSTQSTLQWIRHPQATGYRIDLYSGDQQAGDLIISSYIEGSKGYDKAIEIYNGTGKDIDLSKYSLRKQTNGSGSFGTELSLKNDMHPILANGENFLIVSGDCTNEALINRAQMIAPAEQEKSLMSFNGDDAIGLYHNGIQIDVIGDVDTGKGATWGVNVTYMRKAEVTHPTTVCDWSEWINLGQDVIDRTGTFTMQFAPEIQYVFEDKEVGEQTEYPVSGLMPNHRYTYRVTALSAQGEIETVNTMGIKTSPLESPEVLDATEITENSFVANWDIVPGAEHYLIDLYTLIGDEEVEIFETFTNVKDGTPLPEGWTGNASGHYESSTNSKEPNSLAFKPEKGEEEYIQTCDYPAPVTELSFWYKFVSGGVGSTFKIEKKSNGIWSEIDIIEFVNSAQTVSYSFTKDENITAFRFTYHKEKGNFALDNVSVTYGGTNPEYIVQDKIVTDLSCKFEDLKKDTEYYYQVRSAIGDILSEQSERVAVKTSGNTESVEKNEQNGLIFCSTNSGFRILGLQGNETISVYTPSGTSIFETRANSAVIEIPASSRGIYLIGIKSSSGYKIMKVIR